MTLPVYLFLATVLFLPAAHVEGLPACNMPYSLDQACGVQGHSPNCYTTTCCHVCPGSICSGSTYGITSNYYYYTNQFCRAAAHSGALPVCGSPLPIYTNGFTYTYFYYSNQLGNRNGISATFSSGALSNGGRYHSFRLPTQPSAYNLDTGMLVHNFRLTNGSAPQVTCYAPNGAGNVKLAGGPFYYPEGNRFTSQRSPSSNTASTFREWRFDLSSASVNERSGPYMCTYGGTSGTAYLSPVGLAYWGQTRLTTLAMESPTIRVRQGDSIRLTVKGTPVTSIKWRHDKSVRASGPVLQQATTCTVSGLYYVRDEAYTTAIVQATQGMFRLLALKDMDNTTCSGGFKSNGRCVCPPGLYGSDCKKACPDLKFGESCGYSLGSSASALSGAVLCLPDPYGCECVPGFTGPYCNQTCGAGNFGLHCRFQCRCLNGSAECSSYNGRCASNRCQTGYRGDSCQQECSGRSYGQDCKSTCHCDDTSKCHHINGPEQHCNCSSRWMGAYCDIAFVDPVANLSTSRVNPDQPPPVQCAVSGTPHPTTSDVILSADGLALRTQVLQSSPLIVQATNVPPLPAGHVMNVSCCVSTPAGDHCDSALVKPFELLELKNFPLITEVTETSIKVRFPAWSAKTDSGENPVEGYRICYRKSGIKNGTWSYGLQSTNKCNSCVLQADGLDAKTMYDIAVSVRRPGLGGWGKCTPVVAELTKSPDLKQSLVENTLSVLLKEVQYLKTQMENVKTAQTATDNTISTLLKEVHELKNASEGLKSQCSCCSATSAYHSTASFTRVATSAATTPTPSLTASKSSPPVTTKPVATSKPPPTATTEFIPEDCETVYESGSTSDGVYEVRPDSTLAPVRVWCQKGWLVLQRRTDGKQSFNQSMADYEAGFGSPKADYWLGLRHIRRLSQMKAQRLRIELLLDDSAGDTEIKFIELASFQLTSDNRLQFKENSTNFQFGLQSLSRQLNAPFSTLDQDRDLNVTANCALEWGGGWWLGVDCLGANLNGAITTHCSASNPVCAVMGSVVKDSLMLLRPM